MSETVKLRTGEEHSGALVTVTIMTLKLLMEAAPTTFYEFVMLCRNPEHALWGDSAKELADRYLITPRLGMQPVVHDATREIILAAVEGDGLEMQLRSPLLEDAAEAQS